MKKKLIRVIALTLAVLMLVGIVGTSLMSVFAKGSDDNFFAYGAGLSETQIETTAKLLGVDKYSKKVSIKGKDAKKYINEDSKDSEMISSVYITKNNTKKINVEVVNPLAIQNVSALQYSNAAVTAGLESVNIKVGAIETVTGTSALTGVYKALEKSGIKVDDKRTDIANKEVLLVNEIEKNNKNNEEFSKEKLNKIILEVKEKMIEEKQKQGKVSPDKVYNITENVIKDNNFQNIINKNDIKNLNVIFNNFINIGNLNLDQTKKQIQDLLSKVSDFSQKEFNNVQQYIQTPEGKKFIDSIKDKLSKEQFESLINGAKDKLNSKELEDAINKVKENIDSNKLGDLINSAKDKLGISQETLDGAANSAGGFFESIGNFFEGFFKSIGEFFRNLF